MGIWDREICNKTTGYFGLQLDGATGYFECWLNRATTYFSVGFQRDQRLFWSAPKRGHRL